jgi:UDP-glucose 4-epimerase
MIFVTGGAGYIGTHTCVALLHAGYDVTVFDNFCNSQPQALRQVELLSGRAVNIVEGDVRDYDALVRALGASGADVVVHLAGLKSVSESGKNPQGYHETNVVGTQRLIEAMRDCGLRKLIFSSSATVYGQPERIPVLEDQPLNPCNTYGATKLSAENLLRDACASDEHWQVFLLRYFNVAGAHPSGILGESPNGENHHLLPRLAQVALGHKEYFELMGTDYAGADGTGVRDYVHVMDIARGHLHALRALDRCGGCTSVNLGSGKGHSVLQVLRTFEAATGRTVPYRAVPRRSGDLDCYYADVTLAAQLLDWRAALGLERMCEDAWRWHLTHPHGYTQQETDTWQRE